MRQEINNNKTEPENSLDAHNSSVSNEHQKDVFSFKEDALEVSSLSLKEKFEYRKQQQQQILSTMNKDEQKSYILHYYKWYFVFALLAVIGIFQIGKTVYQSTWPTLLSVAFINTVSNSTIDEYVPDTYRDYYNLNKRNHIEVYTNLYKLSEEDSAENSSLSPVFQDMTYYNIYESLDVIICDENALEVYTSSDDTAAIDQCLSENIYNKIKENIISVSDPTGTRNNGKPYDIAIDISDTEFIKNCKLSYQKVYLLIPSTKTKDDQNVVNFIKLIFNL